MAANVADRAGDCRRYGGGGYAAALWDKAARAAENSAGDAGGGGPGGHEGVRPGFRAGQHEERGDAAGSHRGNHARGGHGQAYRYAHA